MNKKFTILGTIAITGLLWLSLTSQASGWTASNYTGSDGTNKCSNCHGGTADLGAALNVVVGKKGTITPSTTFKVDTTYTVAVTVTGGSSSKRGANSTVVTTTGASTGAFSGPVDGRIYTDNGVKIFSHSKTNATGIFAYDWTPDNTTPDTVKVYSTGIASNSNGSTAGDHFLEAVGTLTKDKTSAIENTTKAELALYPNPCVSSLNAKSNISGAIYSLTGQEVITFANVNTVNVSTLTSGKYFVKYSDGINTYTKAIIKL